MNNTPTPRTETDLFEATKVSLEYGNQRLFKKSQSTRIVGEVAFSDGFEYALKHSSKIKQLERELTAVTEQLKEAQDGWHDEITKGLTELRRSESIYTKAQERAEKAEEQRDRLAEALERIADYQGRFAEDDPQSIAAEALAAVKGGIDES
jgi:hypothetical protein